MPEYKVRAFSLPNGVMVVWDAVEGSIEYNVSLYIDSQKIMYEKIDVDGQLCYSFTNLAHLYDECIDAQKMKMPTNLCPQYFVQVEAFGGNPRKRIWTSDLVRCDVKD